MPTFLQRLQPPFPVGFAPRDAANNYLQISVMNPGYVPKLLLIDRGGMIRYQYDGSDAFFQGSVEANLKAKLNELLAAPAKSDAAGAKKKPAVSATK